MIKGLSNESKVLFAIEAQLLSNFGSAITGFALGIWIFKQQESITSLSLLYFFQALPSIFLSYSCGVLVDTFSRKKILVYCDILFFLLLSVLFVCYLCNNLTESTLYAYVACCTVVGITQTIALGALTGCVIDPQKRVTYNTIINLRKTLPRLMAPLIAGFLILYVQMVPLIIINLITYLISLATILLLPNVVNNATLKNTTSGIRQYFVYAIKKIYSTPGMLTSLICLQFSIAFTSLLGVYIIPLALTDYTSFTAGMLTACGGVGALLGSKLLTKKVQNIPELFLPLSIIIQSSAMLICSLTMTPITLAILLFIHFFFVPTQNGCGSTMWQNHVGQEEFGRILSIQGLVLQVTCILVLLIAGPLVEKIVHPFVLQVNTKLFPEIFFYFLQSSKVSSMYIVLAAVGLIGLFVGLGLLRKIRLSNQNKKCTEQAYG